MANDTRDHDNDSAIQTFVPPVLDVEHDNPPGALALDASIEKTSS
jgi:hypothetical protein